MKTILIILAAGKGKRFGLKENKLFFTYNKKPVIFYLLKRIEKFKQKNLVNQVLLVVDKKNIERSKRLVKENNFSKVTAVISGGKKRQDSVFNGLEWIKKRKVPSPLYVGIHDGARLNLSGKLIKRLISGLKKHPAVIPALEVSDTIKSVKGNTVDKTIPRDNLYRVSTPQFFKFKILYDSYFNAKKNNFSATDDAAVVENNGYKVKIIKDDPENIKLTYFNDLKIMIKEDYKIGSGFDIHRLVPHRKLVLGGVEIKYDSGLDGHSDADVLIHAVIDGLLGAAGMGDIGKHFPDTDKKYKNINSTILLKKTLQLILREDYQIINIDTTVFAEKPKLSSYIKKIRKNLSSLLEIDQKYVNIKAKTMEQMGLIGREEAMAARAIVLLSHV